MCGHDYPATEEFFYPERRRPGGLRYECKPCVRAYLRRWRHAHRREPQVLRRVVHRCAVGSLAGYVCDAVCGRARVWPSATPTQGD